MVPGPSQTQAMGFYDHISTWGWGRTIINLEIQPEENNSDPHYQNLVFFSNGWV